MEERKTATVVLSVLLLMGLTLQYLCNRKKNTLSFSTCSVRVTHINNGVEYDEYRAAKKKLALCLSDVYNKKKDTAAGNQIVTIYRQYAIHNQRDSVIYTGNIDSLIKHKSIVFDTLVLLD